MKKPYEEMDKHLKETQKKYKKAQSEFLDDLQASFDSLNTLSRQELSTNTKNRLKRQYARYNAYDLFTGSVMAFLLTKKKFNIEEVVEIETLINLDKLYYQYKQINEEAFNQFATDGYLSCLSDIGEIEDDEIDDYFDEEPQKAKPKEEKEDKNKKRREELRAELDEATYQQLEEAFDDGSTYIPRMRKRIISEDGNEDKNKRRRKELRTELQELTRKQLENTSNGSTYESYMSGRIISDKEQIKKQILIEINQGKELKIEDFDKIVEKQFKQMLKVKEEEEKEKDAQFSGFTEYQAEVMYNEAYKKACEDYGIEEVEFKGIEDEKQTKMCESLSGQIFKVKGTNKVKRYSAIEDNVIEIVVEGLEQGINLPPINDHFHYCRSYIEAIY